MDLPDASSLPDLGPNWTLLKHSGVEESSEDWCLPLPPPPPGLGGGPVLKPEQVCGGAQLAESQAADRRTPTSTPGCVCVWGGDVGGWGDLLWGDSWGRRLESPGPGLGAAGHNQSSPPVKCDE